MIEYSICHRMSLDESLVEITLLPKADTILLKRLVTESILKFSLKLSSLKLVKKSYLSFTGNKSCLKWLKQT
ncbi:hypothetical protein AQUCO_04100179v1 [Aquilegia coerulea]|uniref:Uncharacterized protein n=1 Tax=Aquilegia coerulea TaxID=218851 RepID=A0A2G5CRT1_AQUCA|nr:hypothetical protein AQUCO_04100179v1 [Aquilegia coerulea]